jgi:PTS system galactitol-specific IIC component
LLTSIGIALPDTGSAVVGADTRPLHGLFWMLGKWTIGGIPVGIILTFVVIFAMLFFFHRNKTGWYKAFGYEEEKEETVAEANS